MTRTFRDIIDRWPSPDALALDIDVKVETVRKWRQRGSIPAEHWSAVVKAAGSRGFTVTLEELALAAARAPTAKAS